MSKEKEEVIKIIDSLADVINKRKLQEIEFTSEDISVRIVKSSSFENTNIKPEVISSQPTQVQTQKIESDQQNTNNKNPKSHPGAVLAPMPGVIYLKPQPDKPDFISIGSNIKQGQTVCLIESMKTFSHIKAHKSGTVTKINIKNETAVEYEELLLIIE